MVLLSISGVGQIYASDEVAAQPALIQAAGGRVILRRRMLTMSQTTGNTSVYDLVYQFQMVVNTPTLQLLSKRRSVSQDLKDNFIAGQYVDASGVEYSVDGGRPAPGGRRIILGIRPAESNQLSKGNAHDAFEKRVPTHRPGDVHPRAIM